MTDLSREFLTDLLRVLRRHGSEPWRQLAVALNDPIEREKILRLFGELANVSGKVTSATPRMKPRQRKAPSIQSVLEQIDAQTPARANQLRQFIQDYQARTILTERSDVVLFLDRLGITLRSKESRERLLRVVVKAMIDLPADQLERALKQAREIGKGSYAELFRAITQPRKPQG